MFRKGNRWMAAACVALLLEAVAHTLGTLAPVPDDPAVQSVVTGMKGLVTPMGLGMAPSAWDVTRGLAYFMSIALVALGVLGLAVLDAAPDDRRLHRRVALVLLAANLAMLALWWHYQIPPPLISQVIVSALFGMSLLRDGGSR
jgi:hypothetical protein